ncbi:hypothetical protein Tco_0200447 [Tanacetum coccineum]
MTEMFRLFKELTTRKVPKKVLIREGAKSPVTKKVNSISLVREEEEENEKYDVAIGDNDKETDGPNIEVPVKEAETKNRAENGVKNKPIKKTKNEEVVEALRARVGKVKGKTYNVSPRGAVYDAILKKKITKKEDIEGNFEIPCSTEGLKNVNVLVDQGFDVNAMPYSTYTKLTDEEAGTTSTTLTARLPILNPGEYDLWLMRIEQYFLLTDYSLWEVILNGNKVLKRTGNEYSLKDKNEAKTDKTEHGNGKSVKSQKSKSKSQQDKNESKN